MAGNIAIAWVLTLPASAAIGVTSAFSLAILSATRFSDLRRDGRAAEAAAFGVLTALALAACAGAIVYGIVEIQTK